MPSQTPTTNNGEVNVLSIGLPGSNQVVVLPPTWMVPAKLVAPPIPGGVVVIEVVHPDEKVERGGIEFAGVAKR